LPTRYGGEQRGRLPCAPEIVVACDEAITTAQRQIGRVERKVASASTLANLPRRLKALAAILARFPAETQDEIGSCENQSARIDALLSRIRDLAPIRSSK
jgi:hypothetical protein